MAADPFVEHWRSTVAELAQVQTSVLDIAYEANGPEHATPVILLHGFPYDPRSFDQVVPILNAAGLRTIVPYLRGYGPTRFLSADTQRSGQQAALGSDLVALVAALGLETPILAGYDWGGLASCVATALWPESVAGLVSLASYDVIDIQRQRHTYEPFAEHA